MLSERKRFNYMVNTNHTTTHSKSNHSSTVKIHNPTHPNPSSQRIHNDDKENNKKKEDLEEINRQLVEETAKQFKKLEQDVQRVEQILQDKEASLEQTQRQNNCLREEVEKVNEEKKILIEAIFEKDIVIKQYEEKIQQMLQKSSREKTPQAIENSYQSIDCGVSTDFVLENRPEQMSNLKRRNLQLQEQVFRLKEQLFDASNKVKVITQQFQAYKILKQIQSLQDG